MSIAKNKVTIVVPNYLFPISGGGDARTLAMSDFLRKSGFSLSIATFKSEKSRTELQKIFDEIHFFEPRNRIVFAAQPKILEPQTYIKKNINIEFNEFVARTIDEIKPTAVITNFAWTAGIFPMLTNKNILKILDSHDIQHLRSQTALKKGGLLSSHFCSLEEERFELSKASVVIAIKEEDKKYLEKILPKQKVICCKHSLTAKKSSSPQNSRKIFFIGNNYDPNIKGIRKFIEHAWGKIIEAVPDAELEIYGSVCAALNIYEQMKGIKLKGIVDDISQAYKDAAIVINPALYGTGLPIKSVEALSYGRCLVSTKDGLRGLPPHDAPIIEAEYKNMAAPIIELLLNYDKRNELEEKAVKYIEKYFSGEAVYGELLELIKENSQNINSETIPKKTNIHLLRYKNYSLKNLLGFYILMAANKFFKALNSAPLNAKEINLHFQREYIRKTWELLKHRHNIKRIAIYGAGAHSLWLEGVVFHVKEGPEVVAVLDDATNPNSTPLWGLKPEKAKEWNSEKADAVLISTDTAIEKKMKENCRKFYGKRIKIVDIYEGFPPGPYVKQ